MPRELRPLDPSIRPEAAFAAELRKLYEEAGKPKFLQMSRKTGKSRTALSEAVGGDHLPTWETVAAFVTACGANPDDWRARWEHVRDQIRTPGSPESVSTDDFEHEPAGQAEGASAEDMPRSATWRRALPFVLVAVITATVSVGTTLALNTRKSSDINRQPTASVSSAVRAIIAVQNKIALGANELIEDATPAYLATVASPYCADKNCKVEGTEMASGAIIVAVCHVQGVEMFNYNLDSSESKTNPHRVRSSLWYKATFPDGRAGYISEVYIAPADRGGLGLPTCANTLTRSSAQ